MDYTLPQITCGFLAPNGRNLKKVCLIGKDVPETTDASIIAQKDVE
jgi:hypothetical protein